MLNFGKFLLYFYITANKIKISQQRGLDFFLKNKYIIDIDKVIESQITIQTHLLHSLNFFADMKVTSRLEIYIKQI